MDVAVFSFDCQALELSDLTYYFLRPMDLLQSFEMGFSGLGLI